jgi:hypothetical protein
MMIFYVHENVNCPYSDIYFLFFFFFSLGPIRECTKSMKFAAPFCSYARIVGTAVKAVCLHVGGVFRRVSYPQSEAILITCIKA